MSDSLVLKLFLSFITGFIWIALLTVLAERFGTRVGGAIAGIPATIVVAILFIGITQSPEIALQSTTLVPVVVGINALFTVFYIFLARIMNYSKALLISALLWFFLSFILMLSGLNSFLFSLVMSILFILISYYILEKKFNIVSVGKRPMQYTALQLVFRGLVGGSLIFFAVLIANISGPLISGVVATFPALTIALIIISQLCHGRLYTEALLKNFIITGAINVVIFVIAVRYVYMTLGWFLGTILSVAVSLVASYLGYRFINQRMA